MNLRQKELFEWQQKNFTQDHLRGKSKEELIEIIGLLQMALGMAEEVGEICHHILKGSQEIRGGVGGIDKKQVADGIGDFTVFGSQCLSHLGMDAEEEIEQVIDDVLKRDWKKDPSGDGCQVQGARTESQNPILVFAKDKKRYVSWLKEHPRKNSKIVKYVTRMEQVRGLSDCEFVVLDIYELPSDHVAFGLDFMTYQETHGFKQLIVMEEPESDFCPECGALLIDSLDGSSGKCPKCSFQFVS